MFPSELLIEDQHLPLVVRQNARAKRISIRLASEVEAEVILTLPTRFSKSQVLAFIEKSKPWIGEQLAKTIPKLSFHPGMNLPILGKSYELRYKPSKAALFWWGEDYVLFHAPPDKFKGFVQKSLKKLAEQFLKDRTLQYAEKLGVDVKRITVKDTKTRWGSCCASGKIAYSWRLIFAPEDVADYVCAHEVAHMREMNHSPEFWKIVADLCPDYKRLRKWLRQNGKSLFQYGLS